MEKENESPSPRTFFYKMIQKITKAIAQFNKYKGSEANAEILEINKDFFRIKFSGHMCFTCGFHDYFDDLKFELEEFGLKTRIGKIVEEKGSAKVTYNKNVPDD